jgi:hypothetical protein
MAVMIAAIIIAGAMAFIFRYEIEPVSIDVASNTTGGRASCRSATFRRAGWIATTNNHVLSCVGLLPQQLSDTF